MNYEDLITLAAMSGAMFPAGPSEGKALNSKHAQGMTRNLPVATDVIDFWCEAGPKLWFAKDPEFDDSFKQRFLSAHEAAVRRGLSHWLRSAEGALALILLLDQFPRNAFRGTSRMYASDPLARSMALRAIDAGFDQQTSPQLRIFFYLPFAHSEAIEDQERCVRLTDQLGPPHSDRAKHHRDIIVRFGRFPHRNPILGREMTEVEQQFLDAGGYTG